MVSFGKEKPYIDSFYIVTIIKHIRTNPNCKTPPRCFNSLLQADSTCTTPYVLIVGLNLVLIMLAFSKLFSKRVCFRSRIRNFVDGGLSWTYIHPYQAVKIDLCDTSSSKRWTTEGADKEFQQCLACKMFIHKSIDYLVIIY